MIEKYFQEFKRLFLSNKQKNFLDFFAFIDLATFHSIGKEKQSIAILRK
jgi:hypothetical protein